VSGRGPWVVVAGVTAGLMLGVGAGLAARWWPEASGPSTAPDPAAAVAPPTKAPRVTDGRPHVVLLIGCTVRLDQVTPYGGHPEATPTLQALADRGVRFADAVSAAPWTRAASTALLTGHHAIEVGMIEPGPGANRRRLADEVDTLAEKLQRAGYTTVGTTANPNLNELFGFHQGFDHYLEVSEQWGTRHVAKVPGRQVVDGLLARVDELPVDGSPLYLQAMLIDAHEPRAAPPRAVARMVDDDELPERVGIYRVNLRKFDEAVKQLLEGLAERGIDDPLVVVVSDHGEGLAYPLHHGKGHGTFTYSSAVRMPWLVAGPGVAEGHVVRGVASQVDVLPTLLELTGTSRDGYGGPGHSWAAAVRGETDRTDRDVAWVDTWFQDASRVAAYRSDRACHRDTVDLGANEARRLRPKAACYARPDDPWADRPLDDVPAEALDELDRWRAARWEAFEGFAHTRDVRPGAGLEDHLEALGYLQDDEP